MSATSQSPSIPSEESENAEGIPWVLLGMVALCVAGLAAATVRGALATNVRQGAHLLERSLHEKSIAAELGLDASAIRRGRAAFMETCTACHGPNGEAKPNLGKELRGSDFIGSKSIGQLVMFLKLGRSTWDPANTTGVAMPPKGGNPMLDDDALRDLAQFVLFLQGG